MQDTLAMRRRFHLRPAYQRTGIVLLRSGWDGRAASLISLCSYLCAHISLCSSSEQMNLAG